MMVATLPTLLLPWFVLQLAGVLMPKGLERFKHVLLRLR